MPHGKLTVVVESATDIKDPTSNRRGDSYCSLQCGSQVLSTHVAEGGGSYPVYHTQFEFEIDRSTNDLAISVYSRDLSRSEDALIGYTALDFNQVFYHGHVVPLSAYPLTRSSGKSGGSINISLDFKVRPSPYMNGSAHAPVRQHSAPQHHARSDFDDGYGSSGSDSSRGSTSRRSSTGSANVRRTQSEPNDHRFDHQIQYYQEVPRPSPLAPSTRGPARRPIPGGPQPPRVEPYQAQPVQQPVYYQAPQQPVYIQVQAAPQQPVYNQPQAQQRPVQQRRPVQQQRPVLQQQQQRPVQQQQQQQQQQQGPSVAAQVGTVVAATAAKAVVQGLLGLL